MSDKREFPQQGLATSVPDNSPREGDGRPAKAIALLNYAEALRQYLEEGLAGLWPGRGEDKPLQTPADHLVALDALASVTLLLTAVGAGKQVDAVEFDNVLTQITAAFSESGVVGEGKLAATTSHPDRDAAALEGTDWSIPGWCAKKLCRGIEELSSGAPEQPQG
ncbi:MAG: hypothetical protein ACJ8FY_05540 [Gemmataceae bacterium]